MTQSSAPKPVDPARIAALTEREEAAFKAARPKSLALMRRAERHSPGGVPSSFQASPPFPIFIDRGLGSSVWDADGNHYVDFHNGFGVNVVGHAHPKIVAAVTQRIGQGSHFAQPGEEFVVVAEELAQRFGLPQWRFTNSGTESTLDAIRLARAFTGREGVMKIEATYHGHHDSLMVSVEPSPDKMGPADAPQAVPQSEGIPHSVVELVTVVPFNDLAAAEAGFQRRPGQIACIIVEPAMMNVGIVIPEPGYLDGLRELAHRHGALLVFDEVKTGVTLAPGGATDRFGVTPDIVCLAKAIGGGLPCGAVGGREDIMALISDGRVSQMGTFNGNALTMAASRVTLTEILTPMAYAHFDALGEVLQGGLDQVISEHELPFHAITMGARGGLTYRAQRVRNYRDYLETDKTMAYLSWLFQSNRGVLMAPGAEENWTVSVQHSEGDAQRFVDNFSALARELRD
ncbi:MAG TPA: aspartate aminotransferase family protein [Candidatus Dormibacteraeota bacterium]|nr:aspartate aminotransferase family protein [Candidatus Dormibacteraeota bacterium]